MKNETIRILLERQKKQIVADLRAEIQKHWFQAYSDGRSIQELNGIIESQRGEIDHALAGDEQLRRDQHSMARDMGSPRNIDSRRQRTRDGPEPACVRSPFVDAGGTCRRRAN